MEFSVFHLAIVFGLCSIITALGEEGNINNSSSTWNIFHDRLFWRHFENEVQLKAWSCNFSNDILQKNLENDAALYKNDTVFKKRRYEVQKWTQNTTLWITTILGACKELSNKEHGIYTRQLKELNMLEAFSDYVDHLNFFQMVANKMTRLGEQVKPISQDFSSIHDIDKLDPVMVVGYSEKFEDKMNTSIWDICVQRHTKINPHHQAHCMWHGCCQDADNSCKFCEDLKKAALREMVCDKVSRRVQKNLDGKLTLDMWNVDISFFDGLPEDWLRKAEDMLQSLKEKDTKL